MNTLTIDGSHIWADLECIWPELAWESNRVSHGAFHLVACLGSERVVRVSTGHGHRDRSEAEHANAQTVADADLPLLVPVPSAPPHHTAEWSATVFSYIPGEVRETLAGPRTRELLIGVLAELAKVDVTQLAQGLREVRAWCGGDDWADLVKECVAVLPSEFQALAHQLVEDVLTLASPPRVTLVHGDLGLHNMLFAGTRPVGLIDWDNATVGDPAIDIAPFIRQFPLANLAATFDHDLLARARCHSKTLSLQVAAAARLAGDQDLELHAVTNFHQRALEGSL